MHFDVTYQLARPDALEPSVAAEMRQLGPLAEKASLFHHLKKLLVGQGLPEHGSSVNECASSLYEQFHEEAFDSMDDEHPHKRALLNWTDTHNQYTTWLQLGLMDYVETGEINEFENEDHDEEFDPRPTCNPLEEERSLTMALLRIPPGKIRTKRVTRAWEEAHFSKPGPGGDFAISGTLQPGDFASNYPQLMSATTGGDLLQFGYDEGTRQEVRFLDFIAKSGRPLMKINPVDDTELEVLYHPRNVFQLVAVAYAMPSALRDPSTGEAAEAGGSTRLELDDVCRRVSALYVEVPGKDAREVPNINSGVRPSHFLPDIEELA